MAGLAWQNDNYVCHEAVCPTCGRGGRYGSGTYAVELRVYFSGGPAKSIKRSIRDMRIKCSNDGCTVGTGDAAGLYLIRDGEPGEWPPSKARRYLANIGSPFAHAVGASGRGCLFWIVVIGLALAAYAWLSGR